MAKNINFEVQIMQGGRWTIHARFPASQREPALEEAKQLDKSNIGGGVRVIRDVYDSDTGTSNEFTIYKSASAAGVGGSGGGTSGGSDYGSDDDDDDAYIPEDDSFIDDPDELSRIRKQRKAREREEGGGSQTTLTGLIIKLLLIILGSTVFAMGAAFGANELLEGANVFGTRMRGAALENFVILVFFVMFVATAILLSSQAFKGKKLKEKTPRKPRPAPAPRQQRAAARSQAPAAKAESPRGKVSVDSDAMEDFRADAAERGGMISLDDELGDVAELAEALADGLPDFDDDDDDETPSNDDEEATEETPAEDESSEEAGDDAAIGDVLAPHEEKQKSLMMDFMKEGLEGAGAQTQSMSNFDKFGVSLFVAGAAEALSQTQELNEKARAKIMADGVQTMGFKRSHASSFAEKYEEYLVQDPTYMQMFQAGRNAMNTYTTDKEHVGKHLESALTEWNKPKKKEAESGPVTVLFTDIAGSTAMTQALGDAGAQQVVRGHNRVVREALSQWSGKEVKHTGDGIMASFAKTSDSLDAAIQMQRECEVFRQQNPDLPLRLKIGINAGEPIAEDNDLFGSTVQMSARIVDKAQADEIYVSEIVRGICAGKTYKFANKGTFPMKGFDTDPTLYEVLWQEGD